ncbi:unnamed protein product [Vitrella brassicaformis CCMP3155]|uniref:Uncharacterized protein n=1 Tax=Vitrella brassicaformis (strain CCMP3155) TaxID=1169540 RepID=A0A0G4F2B8_VITBC|nr:unnamed protein product [Vitrella brassicaformis CCMP3155]|eukprot:CEM05514.1 unnamed protein product [Vitrella brassicaformis CCMP3155]
MAVAPRPFLLGPGDVPFLRTLIVRKAVRMATTNPGSAERAALHSQINNHTRQQELLLHTLDSAISMLRNDVKEYVDEALRRLGIADAIDFEFDVDGLEGGLRLIYLLHQGAAEWPAIGCLVRLAFNHRLTPRTTRPLRVPAESVPHAAAFHQLPLSMAIYRLIVSA